MEVGREGAGEAEEYGEPARVHDDQEPAQHAGTAGVEEVRSGSAASRVVPGDEVADGAPL